jgi:endoribonuclease Dicer
LSFAVVEEIRHYLVDKMEHIENEGEKVKFFASAKLRTLIALLEKISGTMDDPANKLKALVFVQRRYTSKCLYHIIRRYAEATLDCHMRPDFIVGHNNALPESIEAILQTKNNKKTLDKFKKNETNLICASSVLEEGIDLQMCNVGEFGGRAGPRLSNVNCHLFLK